jgi:hypothetical protein
MSRISRSKKRLLAAVTNVWAASERQILGKIGGCFQFAGKGSTSSRTGQNNTGGCSVTNALGTAERIANLHFERF